MCKEWVFKCADAHWWSLYTFKLHIWECVYTQLYECVNTQFIECVTTHLEAYMHVATSLVHHILLSFLPQGRNQTFGASDRAFWLVWMLGFGRVTSIIANDFANKSSHRINKLRRIESWKVFKNLRSQSSQWRTDLIANDCKHRQVLFSRTFLEVDALDNHYTFKTTLTVSM